MFWNAVTVAVGRVSDPCLRVEQVVIKNSSLKKELKSGPPKNEERNVYQKAANLLSTVIHMTKFEFEKGSQYFCKICGNPLEQEKEKLMVVKHSLLTTLPLGTLTFCRPGCPSWPCPPAPRSRPCSVRLSSQG